jgi:hypothetical protein
MDSFSTLALTPQQLLCPLQRRANESDSALLIWSCRGYRSVSQTSIEVMQRWHILSFLGELDWQRTVEIS